MMMRHAAPPHARIIDDARRSEEAILLSVEELRHRKCRRRFMRAAADAGAAQSFEHIHIHARQ